MEDLTSKLKRVYYKVFIIGFNVGQQLLGDVVFSQYQKSIKNANILSIYGFVLRKY